MTETTRTPIATDIPVERAWKVGRRIYVTSGYKSKLSDALYAIGATWDKEVRALWVGSGKLDKVLPLIAAHAERVAAVEAIKSARHWIIIPYEAATIREQAKRIGGIWDNEQKIWAMPTAQTLVTIQHALDAWVEAIRVAQQTADVARIANVKVDSQAREDRLIVSSSRTLTGARGNASGRLHGRMRRAEAEQAKPQPGDVRRLPNGQRVLVLTSTAEFWSQNDLDDFGDSSEEAGWRYRYTYAAVESTAAEIAQDAAEQALIDDRHEIRAILDAAERLPKVALTHRVAGSTITCKSPGGLTAHGGRITVTADNGIWYQHPGWYDSFIPLECRITDPTLIARIRAVIAAGTRIRGDYTVTEEA